MSHASRAVTDVTGESGMTKLKRNADGSYSGTYKGHEFTVRKVWRGEWNIRCGEIDFTFCEITRRKTISLLQKMLDAKCAPPPAPFLRLVHSQPPTQS